MSNNTNSHIRFFFAYLPILIGAVFVFSIPGTFAQDVDPAPAVTTTPAQDAADLNQQIAAKRQEVERLKQQSSTYQTAVDQAGKQVKDLKTQLTTIENQIALTDVEIQSKETEIEALQLEMTALQNSIDAKTDELRDQRAQLSDALRQLEQSSRTPLLNVLLVHSNLNEFYDQAEAVASVSDRLQTSVGAIRRTRDELQAKQDQLTKAKSDVEQAQLQLQINRQSSQEQRELQSSLVGNAQQTASQYDAMLQQSVKEEQNANATISALERQLQQQLNGGGADQPVFSSSGFIWPIASRTITAYFRDPSYPFSCRAWKSAYCLEHSGIDISTPQGTPVRATADGVVSVISNQGFYTDAQGRKLRSALNFVGLVHGDGLASRYLHLSAIYVSPDQFVKQGDVIGLSGGLPGTAGAGGITTGAHLHFEVRVNGIPDDPLRYLN